MSGYPIPDDVLQCGCVLRCAVVDGANTLTLIPCRQTCANYRNARSRRVPDRAVILVGLLLVGGLTAAVVGAYRVGFRRGHNPPASVNHWTCCQQAWAHLHAIHKSKGKP